jgi:hypothetical protein
MRRLLAILISWVGLAIKAGRTVASADSTRALCMTDGGCNGEDEGSNCEDVAVEAGAGAAGFMTMILLVKGLR